MGQQQLLLVILVTILVGIATVVAINVFGSAAENANRDAVRQDLLAASAQAQGLWTSPVMLGGTGGDFAADPPTDDQFIRRLGIAGVVTDAGTKIENENAVYTVGREEFELTITADPKGHAGQWEMTVTRNTEEGATSAWTVEITDDQGEVTRIGQDNTT